MREKTINISIKARCVTFTLHLKTVSYNEKRKIHDIHTQINTDRL